MISYSAGSTAYAETLRGGFDNSNQANQQILRAQMQAAIKPPPSVDYGETGTIPNEPVYKDPLPRIMPEANIETRQLSSPFENTNEGNNTLLLEIGSGLLLENTQAAEAVFVADTDIADVKTSPGEAVFLFGKKVGGTTLIATNHSGQTLFKYKVIVIHAISQMNEMLGIRFPNQNLRVSSSKGSLMLTGQARTTRDKDKALSSLRASAQGVKIIDQSIVTESDLIRLDVRLLEVNRGLAERIGVDWNAVISANGFFIGANSSSGISGGYDSSKSTSLNATMDMLVRRNAASILTETSLSTISGKEARFEVGGEVPIPTFSDTTNNNNVSLDYKFIGLNLTFSPIKKEENKIHLKIASSITNANPSNVVLGGNVFSTLNTRRFQTEVELRDRQSFVIAGLSKNETFALLRDLRGAAGSTFLNKIFGQQQTGSSRQEMIIVVTPFFKGVDRERLDPKLIRTMTNLEFLLEQKNKTKNNESVKYKGVAGFIY